MMWIDPAKRDTSGVGTTKMHRQRTTCHVYVPLNNLPRMSPRNGNR